MSIASHSLIGYLETLIERTSLTQEEKDFIYYQIGEPDITTEEANTIIEYLKDNLIDKFQF